MRRVGSLFLMFCLALALGGPALADEGATQKAAPATSPATTRPTTPADAPAFRHRGFYLHTGWFYKYPFAVRTWRRDDFANMFALLRHLGMDQVTIWPMLEAIPAPLGEADAAALRDFRLTVDDAKKAGLECWLVQCPNLTPRPEIAAKPWRERNPYKFARNVRLDNPQEAGPYLAHRTAMMQILNNADGYVTIDGDPGGYAGAAPADFLKVFLSDRAAVDRFGVDPKRQKLVPWIWAGWGMGQVWSAPTEPFARASMEALRAGMPEPWVMLPGRSIREGWANGRVNVLLADQLKLMDRSTILCYEAIEFEPTPPAAVLQFEDVRRIVRQELPYADRCRGIMGNAQQPVMVLPNLYLFARGTREPAYLDQPDEKVLADFAELLGGPADVLSPAWSCLRLGLDALPADLPARLRAVRLTGAAGRSIPGGPERFVDILSRKVESRRGLLEAVARKPATPDEAAVALADGVRALVGWWEVHRYVFDGDGNEPFEWRFVRDDQVQILRQWCKGNVKDAGQVAPLAARRLVADGTLAEAVAPRRVAELLAQ